MSNKFTAMKDETNLDFMPFRVIMKTSNGARMIARCDNLEDAKMIAEALELIEEKPIDDKVRITL